MNAMVLLVAASAVGLDVGWTPLPTGGTEYIIQIEPDLVDTLLKKNDLESAIPAGLDVRLVRVHVGTDKLPHDPLMSAIGAKSAAGAPTKAADPAVGGASPAPAVAPIAAPAAGGAAPSGAGSGATGVLPFGPPPGYVPPAKAGAADPAGSAPPSGSGATAPSNIAPIGAGPAAGSGAAVGGPALDFPATNPATKKTRDAVSGAFDDPAAPGRAASADTGQPHLTREEMLAGAGSGSLLAAHEANRPQDFDRAANQNNVPISNGFANGNNSSNNGRNFNNNPNERNNGDPSEKLAATGPANEPKPWSALIFTVAALLVSVAFNFYLGWVAYDSRFRYRELLAQTGDLPLPV